MRQGRGWNECWRDTEAREHAPQSHDEGKKTREIAKGDVRSITYIQNSQHIHTYIHTAHPTTYTNKLRAPHTMHTQADVELARPASPSRRPTRTQSGTILLHTS